MDATGQMFQISKFPDTLSFVIVPRMFWRNLTKIGLIYIPYKFTQSGCIYPKIKREILAHKGSQTTRATPGDYLTSWNRKPIGQRDLLTSMTMDQDCPRKETPCRHVFFQSQSLRGALRRTTQWWAKLPKAKKKPAAKREKSQNELRSKTTNQHTALYFVQGWYLHKEKETLFLTSSMANFG